MSDETRETAASGFLSSRARPPRQIVENVIEILGKRDTLSANAKTKFNQSIRLLDQCIGSRQDNFAYSDAVERAPWLTSDIEQLKRQWSELRRSLHSLYQRARRGGCSHKLLINEFGEFAERFLECEVDEQCFLQAAFPGPGWTDENPDMYSF